MPEPQAQSHLYRISNCLQTILELETALKRLEMGHALVKEFVVLKAFLEKIDRVDLREEDVLRIERATSTFLDELKGPLSQAGERSLRRHPLQ